MSHRCSCKEHTLLWWGQEDFATILKISLHRKASSLHSSPPPFFLCFMVYVMCLLVCMKCSRNWSLCILPVTKHYVILEHGPWAKVKRPHWISSLRGQEGGRLQARRLSKWQNQKKKKRKKVMTEHQKVRRLPWQLYLLSDNPNRYFWNMPFI